MDDQAAANAALSCNDRSGAARGVAHRNQKSLLVSSVLPVLTSLLCSKDVLTHEEGVVVRFRAEKRGDFLLKMWKQLP